MAQRADLRAAQRAFFAQATAKAAPPETRPPAPAAAAALAQSAAAARADVASTPAPDRNLRPGSLLDIRV